MTDPQSARRRPPVCDEHFRLGGGKVLKAVDGVDFSIPQGQRVRAGGRVRERQDDHRPPAAAAAASPPPAGYASTGTDIAALGASRMRALRRRMQIVFQDPYSSLDPRMTVGNAIVTPMEDPEPARRPAARARGRLLERVGLSAADMERYPHEFSGGQRQRIGIARALAVDPEFIVADEPVSALDVSIRSQVLNLLKELQAELGLTYLFISHDLSVVQFMATGWPSCTWGRWWRWARPTSSTARTVTRTPAACSRPSRSPTPVVEQSKPEFSLQGEIASPINPPPGCRFYSRCPLRVDDCRLKTPPLEEIVAGHWVACWRVRLQSGA